MASSAGWDSRLPFLWALDPVRPILAPAFLGSGSYPLAEPPVGASERTRPQAPMDPGPWGQSVLPPHQAHSALPTHAALRLLGPFLSPITCHCSQRLLLMALARLVSLPSLLVLGIPLWVPSHGLSLDPLPQEGPQGPCVPAELQPGIGAHHMGESARCAWWRLPQEGSCSLSLVHVTEPAQGPQTPWVPAGA